MFRPLSLITALTLPAGAFAADVAAVIEQNAVIAHAAYEDSLTSARTLREALAALVDNPSEASLDAARTAWREAREPYGQTEVYRFRGGPIDDLNDEGQLVAGEGAEGRINAWPLDEALIDYVAAQVDGNSSNSDQPAAGFIQDAGFEISPAGLAAVNEFGENEANVATGYHAIEFLLWGQDLNAGESAWDGESPRDATPGQRPYTDYVAGEGCTNGTAPAEATVCQRRGAYLLAAADLLIDDLARVTEAWAPGADNYRARFTDPANQDQSLLKMLVGMGSLSYGELAGERILVALAAASQEDEHSCFSDNTHRDIYLNALGIRNTYLGEYTRIDGSQISGPGIYDLLKASDAALAEQLKTQLDATQMAAQVIVDKADAGTPFDQLVAQYPGKDADDRPVLNANMANNLLVNNVVVALQTQTGSIEAAIAALLGEVSYEIEDSPAFF